MKMNKFGICLILCVLVTSFALAQKGQKSWDFVPTPEYKEACRFRDAGYYEEAVVKFREIANNNPGTPLAAECQANIALLSDNDKAIQEYEDMVVKYPGTGYELGARGYIIDSKYLRNFDTWLAKKDELITSVGGKSIYEIIGLRSSSNRGSAQEIPAEYKNSVAAMYGDIGASLMGYNVTYGKNDSKKLDQAFKMLTYVRENFPTAPCSATVKGEISGPNGIFERWGFKSTEVDRKPPTIKMATPEYNNVYLIWRRPIIRVFMYDGDINQSQIDLAALEFKLDGVDLKDKMKTKIVTLRPRNPHDAKKIVEKIFIWYRPEKPLSRGLHTILVNAKDYAGNSVSAKNTFVITTPRKAGEDVEEDDPSWIDRILKEFKDK